MQRYAKALLPNFYFQRFAKLPHLDAVEQMLANDSC